MFDEPISSRKITPNFKSMTHKEVLEYYLNHPDDIENGLRIKQKEAPILRGRIDLLAIDKHQKICFIEVVHRSHCSRAYYEGKLRSYRLQALWLVRIITKSKQETNTIRLIIVKPNKSVIDVDRN